jgi:hypothetical protein
MELHAGELLVMLVMVGEVVSAFTVSVTLAGPDECPSESRYVSVSMYVPTFWYCAGVTVMVGVMFVFGAGIVPETSVVIGVAPE